MQARMTYTFVPDLAEVDWIREHLVERSTVEPVAARLFAVLCDSYFGSDASSIQILHQQPYGTEFQVSSKDPSHCLRFRLIHNKVALNHVVTNRNQTADPHPLLLGGGDLVPDPLPGDF